jgi:integrase
VSVTTLDKYKATLNQLKRYSSKLSVKSITSNEAKKFAAYLKPLYVPIVLKERIGLLRACWEWAKLPYNPWTDVRIKVPPIQPPKPFTPNEIRQILAQFKSQHYYSYVLFLFSTGCRTSEAIGLRWGHICGDRIWIGESLTKGVRKSTKTNRARTIPIPTTLKPHLIRPHNSGDDDLVFTTPTGCPIDDNNFCNRYWKPALEAAGVPYRRPYNTRHSFISNCLQQGLSPVEIASLTGHQLETLYTHYAGLVSKPQIPVLF